MLNLEPVIRPLLSNKIIAWFLLGLLALWAVRWQYRLLKNDYANLLYYWQSPTVQVQAMVPPRVRSTLVVCLLIAVGVVVDAFMSLQAGFVSTFPLSTVIAQLLLLLPLFGVLAFKSFLGPIFTVGALAFALFYYVNFNQFMLPPAMEALFDFAASLLPEAWERFYIFAFTLYALATSWHDSLV